MDVLKRNFPAIISMIHVNIPQVCFVFTDGDASDKEKVPAASAAWADDGVKVYAIGIGSGISYEGLRSISGSDSRALVVDNFEDIGVLAQSLLKKVCEAVGE